MLLKKSCQNLLISNINTNHIVKHVTYNKKYLKKNI
jgi:hypothetical protein